MTNSVFKGLEVASSLLLAYNSLAQAHKRSTESVKANAKMDKTNVDPFANYKNCFGLVLLNASIIEGSLRSILSSSLVEEINRSVNEAKISGRTGPSKAEIMLTRFHNDVEMQGGWEPLKSQYKLYFDISLDALMGEALKEPINVLFTLRNILAHGTAIVQPKSDMDETMKDMYPYNWQKKLQQTRVYLERIFGNKDIFENLAEYEMPIHFMDKTKELFVVIKNEINPLPERSQRIFEMVEEFRFGFISNGR
ncbi:MAG: hypothetical protein AB2697_19830 [Candidatus Thiodiazotropha endolucinida]